MTSRGLVESDFVTIAQFVDQAIDLAIEVQKISGPKLKAFSQHLQETSPAAVEQVRRSLSLMNTKKKYTLYYHIIYIQLFKFTLPGTLT